ncbi:MAG: hypothetical protein IPK24_00115 [Kineosporiaceae bacterium]|nr:hypothetical protein [Kineosporiaceae bacterium]MBK8073978.1 hypothetical protein [Kineosporiaceae bacterium]
MPAMTTPIGTARHRRPEPALTGDPLTLIGALAAGPLEHPAAQALGRAVEVALGRLDGAAVAPARGGVTVSR